jgi:CubicO group peptidase (beta-lactamase class C family)
MVHVIRAIAKLHRSTAFAPLLERLFSKGRRERDSGVRPQASAMCPLLTLTFLFCTWGSPVLAAAVKTTSSPARFAAVDSIVQQAIRDHQIPGAVLLIGHNGQIIYRKAFGERALEPRREPMTVDTIFDLASLTKVVATTTSVMQLVERGKIRVADPVSKYLPEFSQNGK